MPIVLDAEKLDKAFAQARDATTFAAQAEALLPIMKPIVKFTVDRFPQHLADDLSQELQLFLAKKTAYFIKAYFEGKIKTPTNYFFRIFRNAAINFMNIDNKNSERMVPLADVKVEPVYTVETESLEEVVDRIREETLDFIRIRFPNKVVQRKAERFVGTFLEGLRPSFHGDIAARFAQMERKNAKDVYSVVLCKLREIVLTHMDELLDRR